MKIRKSFVANSSSSSFIITDHNHPAVRKLISEGRIEEGDTSIEDEWDNEIWGWCWKEENNFEWDEFLRQTDFNG